MAQQSLKNQKAEVNFRRKVAKLQTNPQTDNAEAIALQNMLQDRAEKTKRQMIMLKEKQIPLTPYIELGAERCQRSLVMENELDAHGASIDISFETLKSCEYHSKKLAKPNLPIRICCDANNLPFKSNSIPFVFCYQTLHHFPDINTVIQQVHRVLAPKGYFFFDEEPFKNMIHLNLYDKALFKNKSLLKNDKIQDLLNFFLSKREYDAGEEAGILENYNITLNDWKAAVNMFEKTKLTIDSNLTRKKVFAIRELTGGAITGLCQKKSNGQVFKAKPLMDNLICPSCLQKGTEVELAQKNNALNCDRCDNKYPIVKGILILFTKSKLGELYPELAEDEGL